MRFSWTTCCKLCITLSAIIAANSLLAHEPHESLPEIAVSYRTTIKDNAQSTDPQVSQWYFWRQSNRIEIHNLNSALGEIWQKQGDGKVSYSWLAHEQHFILDYSPTDLSLLHRSPDWFGKSTIISTELMNTLEVVGAGNMLSNSTEIYQGEINNLQLQVEWLAEYAIPAKITQTVAGQTVEIELLEVYLLDQSPFQPPASDDYENMDYVDVGDNESHLMVRMHLQNKEIETVQYRHQH